MKLEAWGEIAAFTEIYGAPRVEHNCFFFKQGRREVTLTFYETGELQTRRYSLDGDLHRDEAEGPAYENFHKNGQVANREYSRYGHCSRSGDLPAFEAFDVKGRLKMSEIWHDGIRSSRVVA
jgi:hypothetical protein